MKKLISQLTISVFFLQVVIAQQNVGIGTTTPNATAKLHVEVVSQNNGFLVTGPSDPMGGGSSVSASPGAGSRLMFYPTKSVFRVGTVAGTQWDNANSGRWSTGIGHTTEASATNSVAIGDHTIARGDATIAIGSYNDPILAVPEFSPSNTTPLLLVGNGNSSIRRNALVIYRSGNTDISGFTRLGKTDDASPRIKMKKITGITPNTSNPNSVVIIADGLADGAKILSVDVIVRDGAGYGFIPNTENGSTYTVNLAPDLNGSIVIGVKSVALSSYVMGKAFTILLVYEE